VTRTFLLLILAACGSPAGSQGLQSTGSAGTPGIPLDFADLSRVLDSVMTQGMARESVPGAAFVPVKNGRIVLAQGFGHAALESRRA
jgi:CubicO group peptidase (beta-lactamase class C family)